MPLHFEGQRVAHLTVVAILFLISHCCSGMSMALQPASCCRCHGAFPWCMPSLALAGCAITAQMAHCFTSIQDLPFH